MIYDNVCEESNEYKARMNNTNILKDLYKHHHTNLPIGNTRTRDG